MKTIHFPTVVITVKRDTDYRLWLTAFERCCSNFQLDYSAPITSVLFANGKIIPSHLFDILVNE